MVGKLFYLFSILFVFLSPSADEYLRDILHWWIILVKGQLIYPIK